MRQLTPQLLKKKASVSGESPFSGTRLHQGTDIYVQKNAGIPPAFKSLSALTPALTLVVATGIEPVSKV
jgi:hypothetical protein